MKLNQDSIFFHGGIYRFEWPYLTGSNMGTNDQGEVNVYKCDVELRVGQEEDLKEGKIVTVIITSDGNPGVQGSIEKIATKIRISFFDSIFTEKHWENPIVPEHKIRWIERHLFSTRTGSDQNDEINEVTMIWDAKRHVYHSPLWKPYNNTFILKK